ncbi:MAG: DUF5011 domain-containing protein [Chitinispirillaceae bacterium]|nr:DUF5011 domain-containing protein [Chitinispirillaceae bacterium]
MKRLANLLLLPAMILSLAALCTKVEFNNPLDAKGSNYAGDSLAGDHDGDGIANKFDQDYLRTKDTVPPVITFTGGIGNGDTVIIRQGDPDSVYAKAVVTAYDNVDKDITGRIQKPDIYITQCQVYNVVYRVSDLAGNTAEKPRVIIVDCEGPVITLAGENPMNLKVGAPYTEPGASATDNIDGPLPAASITITGNVTTATAHVDSVIYTVTDRAGNVSTKKRTIIVSEAPDTEPPVITLNGANPLTLEEGTPYVEPGYTAIDNVDGDITNSVVVTGGPVVTTIPGRDTLTYSVSDRAGNSASVKRIIIIRPSGPVKDTIPPVITLKGELEVTVNVGNPYVEPGWTAYDEVDGDLTDSVKVRELNNKPINPINTSAPGTFELIYSVSDSAGNLMEVGRTVRVVGVSTDTVKPVIRLEGAVKCTVDVGSPFVEPGVIATDNIDGNISSNVTKVVTTVPGGTAVPIATFTNTIGNYNITYSVSDAAGNAATPAVRAVNIKDTTIDTTNLLQKYGVPLAAALPNISKEYNDVTTDGTGAPNVSTIDKFTINWDLANRGLYQFSFNLTVDPYYKNFTPTNNFSAAQPGFTLTGSGITGLDGEYYIKADATQCVWVKKDGRFAIIFK